MIPCHFLQVDGAVGGSGGDKAPLFALVAHVPAPGGQLVRHAQKPCPGLADAHAHVLQLPCQLLQAVQVVGFGDFPINLLNVFFQPLGYVPEFLSQLLQLRKALHVLRQLFFFGFVFHVIPPRGFVVFS